MKQRQGIHTVFQLQVHVVFCTKYRYRVLRGEIQERCRDLIRQVCDALDVRILKGVVSADHVHLHLSYRPKHSVSEIMRRIKGRSARKLLQEYPTRTYAVASKLVGEAFVEDTGRTPLSPWYYASA